MGGKREERGEGVKTLARLWLEFPRKVGQKERKKERREKKPLSQCHIRRRRRFESNGNARQKQKQKKKKKEKKRKTSICL